MLAICWQREWGDRDIRVFGTPRADALTQAEIGSWLASPAGNAQPRTDNGTAPGQRWLDQRTVSEAKDISNPGPRVTLRRQLSTPFSAQMIAAGRIDDATDVEAHFKAMCTHEDVMTHALLATAALEEAVHGPDRLQYICDKQSVPAAIVDETGRILAFNKLFGRSRPGRRNIASVLDHRFPQVTSPASQRFRDTLVETLNDQASLGAAIWLREQEIDDHHCLVLLPIEHLLINDLRDSRAGRVLVLFRSLSDPELCSPEFVQSTFGLTPSEARLASALASGATVAAYAASQELTVNTVRWHVRNVLQKLGCRTQTQLIRLVLLSLLR